MLGPASIMGAGAGGSGTAQAAPPNWGCDGDLVRVRFDHPNWALQKSLNPGGLMQIGYLLGPDQSEAEPSTILTTQTFSAIIPDGYLTGLTSFQTSQYSWFYRYDPLGLGAYTDWLNIPTTNLPDCGESEI